MAGSDLFQVSLKDFLLEEYLRKKQIADVFRKPPLWGVDLSEGKADKSAFSSLTTSTKQLDNVGLSPLYRTNYTEAWTETAQALTGQAIRGSVCQRVRRKFTCARRAGASSALIISARLIWRRSDGSVLTPRLCARRATGTVR